MSHAAENNDSQTEETEQNQSTLPNIGKQAQTQSMVIQPGQMLAAQDDFSFGGESCQIHKPDHHIKSQS